VFQNELKSELKAIRATHTTHVLGTIHAATQPHTHSHTHTNTATPTQQGRAKKLHPSQIHNEWALPIIQLAHLGEI
jgi:hypothetical protein